MNGAHQIYSFGEFTLDVERGALRKAGADIKLRPKSFAVLRLLIERAGRLVSKEELLEAVWGRAVVTDGAVTQCLIDVRHALGDESQQMIRTVPRRGYIFDVPVSESRQARPSGVPTPPGGLSLRGLWTRRNAAAALLVLAAIAAAWWSLVTRQTNEVAVQRSPKAPHNSIAVLPFVDLSPQQDQEFLADGISEEILNLLAQAPDLQVIARTSSFSFKGRNADIAEIAAKLHVAHVLEGSVRKSGSRLRITAQLVDAANSAHLWSETYERELKDWSSTRSADTPQRKLRSRDSLEALTRALPCAWPRSTPSVATWNRRFGGWKRRAPDWVPKCGFRRSGTGPGSCVSRLS